MYSIDPVKVIDDRDEYGNAVQMSLLSICAAFAKYFSSGKAVKRGRSRSSPLHRMSR